MQEGLYWSQRLVQVAEACAHRKGLYGLRRLEWVAKAESGDVEAQALTSKYQKRPAEELYDVVNDPHCLKNLINEPETQAIRSQLSNQLSVWMEQQGDQGVATENLAETRQKLYRKK